MSRNSWLSSLISVLFALITVVAGFFVVQSTAGLKGSAVPLIFAGLFILLVLVMSLNTMARRSRLAGDVNAISAKISANAIGGITLFLIVVSLGTIAIRGM